MVMVTGLGSLPGTDFGWALGSTFEETPDLPYLPELPQRGPWAGMVGRSVGLLAGMGAEFSAGQWRLAANGGIDQRRARTVWRDDLDRLEEYAHGYTGPFKVAIAGPWTLAAAVFRPLGGLVLGDRGARRDLAGALAEGVGDLAREVSRRLPGARVLVQVDEPSLPRVLAGGIPTEGGFFRHRAVHRPEAAEELKRVVAEPERRGLEVETLVHCCAPGLPVGLVTTAAPDGAGFGGLSLDQDVLSGDDWDALAAAVEAGARLYLGCHPTSGPVLSPDALTRRALGVLQPLGLGPILAERLVLTPACGLAGHAPARIREIFTCLRAVAPRVEEALAGG